jgi:PAS domain S-box-containing protein
MEQELKPEGMITKPGTGGKTHLDAGHAAYLPQQLLDNLEVAIYTCNADGFITMYNRAAALLWGRLPEIGKDLWCGSWKIFEVDGITPVALETCPMAVTLKTGIPVIGHEIIIQKPNGEKAFVVPYPKPLFDDRGRLTGAINLLVDVTGYKRDEKGQAHMAAIIESSDDAIISKTLDGIITSWNSSAEKIFGYWSQEMIGESLLKIIPKDRVNEEFHIQDQLRKGNRIDHYETKRLTKDGRLLDVSLTISPIFDKQGAIVGASKIARDITRRKRDAQALRESEERYKLAVETAKLGTWAVNLLTNEVVCSRECRGILGIETNVCLTMERMMAMVAPGDSDRVSNEMARMYEPGLLQEFDTEHRIIRENDKSLRWVRVKGKMYTGQANKPEKMIGTMLDITDEKMAKEKLERIVKERTNDLQIMNEQLRKSNHDLEQFAYIASHDLQEPLRKIQSYIEMIERTEDKPTVRSYFDKIRKSAGRMAALIRDVLNYSRIDRNEELVGSVNLNYIVRDIRTDLENLIREKGAVINCSGLPVIQGIDSQLRQLFTNLIGNSLKFCQSHPVIGITCDIPSQTEIAGNPELHAGNKYVRLTVTDNGIGFEQQHAEKIFNIFQRLHARTEYSGTGIGLALCKKIVDNHHGTIRAVSAPGQGSTFTILLPA